MIYKLDPRREPRWSALLSNHPSASVFHTAGWLEALAHTYGYEPMAYTTSPPQAQLENALVVCRVKSWLTGRRLVSLPFSDHCEPLVNTEQELDQLVGALRREVDSGANRHFELRSLRLSERSDGLKVHGRFMHHELDLRPPLGELFRGFHATAVQQMIRRAERELLAYEEGRSGTLLREFYNLMVLTRRRHKLPPAPPEWFRNLLTCLPENATVRIAVRDGHAVAAILTLTFCNTVVYKYGCSDANQHKLGGLAMLLWRTIQEAKARDIDRMDFGRSDLDNAGLMKFKERWGAKPTVLSYYRYPTAPSSKGLWMEKILPTFCDVVPKRVLTAAGSLLYRHIG